MEQFPPVAQAALLFDRSHPVDLDTMIQQFITLGASVGTRYNRVENIPGTFHRLFGDDVMITVEYKDKPAQASAFEAALGTSFCQMTNPNAREVIAKHRSHILVNVHHGAMPPIPEIAALLAKLNMSEALQAGQTYDHFRERLSLCGALALLAHAMGKASLVHWTTSEHLLEGDTFAALVNEGMVPNLLHVLPLLANDGKSADGKDQVAIITLGAKPFIGREIHLVANPVPWGESLKLMLMFLKIATMKQGYIVPDGDTFADENETFSCGVWHVPEGSKSGAFDGPLYRLELLRFPKYGFTSPDYRTPGRVFDDRTVPADIREDLRQEQGTVIERWRARRKMAERIGGRVEIIEVTPPRDGPDSPRWFGRKKL